MQSAEEEEPAHKKGSGVGKAAKGNGKKQDVEDHEGDEDGDAEEEEEGGEDVGGGLRWFEYGDGHFELGMREEKNALLTATRMLLYEAGSEWGRR